jgi:ribosome-binding ATPase
MSINVGIIGMPQSGKSTVFSAFTGGGEETPRRSADGLAPNVGIVKVPDERLRILSGMFKPKKTVPIEIKYIDIGAAMKSGPAENRGFTGELLNQLSTVDTLIGVVRGFTEESIPHPEGSIDIRRDIGTLNLELAFSDLAIIERRLERIENSLKAAKPAERPPILREQEMMLRLKKSLEEDIPVRDMDIDPAELKIIANYQFLSAKPLLVVINIGEDQLADTEKIETEYRDTLSSPKCRVTAVCGKLEAELAAMTEDDARVFREDYGLKESGLEKSIRLSYEISEMMSFFTVGEDECRAWPVHRGTNAQKAAGKIHSDLEKGFIRAETISYDNLIRCGSLAEGRKQGVLRQEGKDYIVQDGDILNILFNV